MYGWECRKLKNKDGRTVGNVGNYKFKKKNGRADINKITTYHLKLLKRYYSHHSYSVDFFDELLVFELSDR